MDLDICCAPLQFRENAVWKKLLERFSLIIYFLRETNLSTGSESWALGNISAAHCSLMLVWLCMFSTELASLNILLGLESVVLDVVCERPCT